MEEPRVQLVRLRLPRWTTPLHVARLLDARGFEDFPGADPVLVANGRILAAHSRAALRWELEQRPEWQGTQAAKVHTVDVRRAGRALSRDPSRWTGETRGTVVELDDLLWDAAASLGDQALGESLSSGGRHHQLYQSVWGNTPAPPPRAERLQLWSAQVRWLGDHIYVLDRHR